MSYEEVLPYLQDGKKIRRKLWDEPKYCNYIYINPHTNVLWASFDDKDVEIGDLSRNNKEADDWEIYEERENKCGDCIFFVKEEGTTNYCAVHDLFDIRFEDDDACEDYIGGADDGRD